MKPSKLLKKCQHILDQRGKKYNKGEQEDSMPQIVSMFEAMSGKTLSPQEGHIFMLALKLVRMRNDHSGDTDHYVDAINYLALAGCSKL